MPVGPASAYVSGLLRVEDLVGPEQRHQLRRADVGDAVRPHGRHVDGDRLVAADPQPDDVVVQDPAQGDLGLSAHHQEPLHLGQMEVVAAGGAGPGGGPEHLAAPAVRDRLHQFAPLVGVPRASATARGNRCER